MPRWQLMCERVCDMEKLVPVMVASIFIVAVTYAFLYYMYRRKLRSNKEWINSLDAGHLRKLEEEVEEESKKNNVLLDKPINAKQVRQLIKNSGYTIKMKKFMPFHEATTKNSPEKCVFIRKNLTEEQTNFALTHELMHIWFDLQGENAEARCRNVHNSFFSRSKEEQDTDYKAACLIMNEKSFREDLNKMGYFSAQKNERREMIHKLSDKYQVAPDAVARRICEIDVLYNGSKAGRVQ